MWGLQQIRLRRWLGVAIVAGVAAIVGCDSDVPDIDECVVATAPGKKWTDADADEYVRQLQPPPGDREERHALFVDALTAFGAMEGDFERYEPSLALRHHREMMADFHFQRTFEEGTAEAIEAFQRYRDTLELKAFECP